MDRAKQGVAEAGRADARPAAPRASGPTLNRILWRWHFWAGLLVGPVLMVASVTGGLFLFKDEAESFLYPRLLQAAEGPRLPLAELVQAAQQAIEGGWSPEAIQIDNQAGGVHSIVFANDEHHHRTLYINAVSGDVLGERPSPNFFSVVRDIHRRLLAGTGGRVLVEMTTCWTVLLTLTGLWLWKPKSWRKVPAALKPRLRGKRYAVLRDWHTIPGVLIAPVAIVVAITGLLYSVLWGTTFLYLGFQTGAFDIVVNPPKSAAPTEPDAPELSPDEAYAVAQEVGAPTARVTIELPPAPDGAFAIKSGYAWGPSIASVVHVDRHTGAVVQAAKLTDLPLMAQWTQWNYPLHIGSVMGMTTKLLWLVVCLVLTAAPVTGVWMWQSRRRRGAWGFPSRLQHPLPRWMVAMIVLLGVAMPMAGLSMLVVGVFEWARLRV